jgi:hypothetical protein
VWNGYLSQMWRYRHNIVPCMWSKTTSLHFGIVQHRRCRLCKVQRIWWNYLSWLPWKRWYSHKRVLQGGLKSQKKSLVGVCLNSSRQWILFDLIDKTLLDATRTNRNAWTVFQPGRPDTAHLTLTASHRDTIYFVFPVTSVTRALKSKTSWGFACGICSPRPHVEHFRIATPSTKVTFSCPPHLQSIECFPPEA